MEEDLIDDIKNRIKQYKRENIVFGKPLEFILLRLHTTKEEIEDEILSCRDLTFVEKQKRGVEERYSLFFIYSRRKGRVYVITFRDNFLRIVTAFPLGRKTLRKYHKKGLNITDNSYKNE